jgi:hypothetical protein
VSLCRCGRGVFEQIQQQIPNLFLDLFRVFLEVELQLLLYLLRNDAFRGRVFFGFGVLF